VEVWLFKNIKKVLCAYSLVNRAYVIPDDDTLNLKRVAKGNLWSHMNKFLVLTENMTQFCELKSTRCFNWAGGGRVLTVIHRKWTRATPAVTCAPVASSCCCISRGLWICLTAFCQMQGQKWRWFSLSWRTAKQLLAGWTRHRPT
jgi:hypothetical protein